MPTSSGSFSGSHQAKSSRKYTAVSTDTGYSGPEPTVLGYDKPIQTQASSIPAPVISSRLPDRTDLPAAPQIITPQAAAPATGSSVVFPTIPTVIGIGIIAAGSGFLIRRWWVHRQNPGLFKKYD
jgi:hypothetical protein